MNFTYEKFFKLLKENLLIILAGGIICCAAAFAYSKFVIDPVYYSQAMVGIQSERQANQTNPTLEVNYARTIVQSYIVILDTNNFFQQVYQSIPEEHKPESVEALRKNTSLTIYNNTEVIQVEYTSKDKDNVKYITAKIVENICNYEPLTQSYKATVSIYDSATEPKISNNNLTMYSAIGFILGMAVVFVIAFLRDMLDTRVKTVNDIKERYNLPVLGAIPTFKGKKIK